MKLKKLGMALGLVVVLSAVVAAWAQDGSGYLPLAKGNKWVYESTSKTTVDLGGTIINVQDTKGTTTDEIVGPSEEATDPKGLLVHRSVLSEKGTVQTQEGKLDVTQSRYVGWDGEWLSIYEEKTEGVPGLKTSSEKYNPPLRLIKRMLKEGDTWEVGTVRQQKVSMPTRVNVSTSEDITVPAGTFKKCLKLVSEVTEPTGQFEGGGFVLDVKKGKLTSNSWYAPGVGLVKEETTLVLTLEVNGTTVELQQIRTRVLQPGYKASQ